MEQPKFCAFAMKTNVQVFVPTVGEGLNNMGNTCFMNATLQAMFYVSQFMNLINKHKCCKPIIYIHVQMYDNHSFAGIKQKECTVCCIRHLQRCVAILKAKELVYHLPTSIFHVSIIITYILYN